MKKFLFWVSGDKNEASRRYRIDCYLKTYENHFKFTYFDNISITQSFKNGSIFYIIFQLFNANFIFLQRRLLPIFFVKLLKMIGKKIIFDIDDGIHVYPIYQKFNFAKFASQLDIIIVGNKELHNFWTKFNSNVIIIETGLEYCDYKERQFDIEKIHLLWVGTSTNFNNLNIFLNILNQCNLGNLSLKIISDKIPPNLNSISFKHEIIFEYWSENTDNDIAKSNFSYIGLMPLDIKDEQSLYKCSFKMLQYMNWSMPVLVSPYGMNLDLLKLDFVGFELVHVQNFEECITQITENASLYKILGKNGNKIVKEKFSHEIISNKYIKSIKYELSNL
jgi:glycosyltransferase involved in cell wall biosynthesis